MSRESVERQLREAPWFERVGSFVADDDSVALGSLAAWSPRPAECSDADRRTAREMAWLPQARSQRDPVHGAALEHVLSAEQRVDEARDLALRFYRVALTSLKAARANALLEPAGKSFLEAARAAALYAARRSAVEVTLSQEGFWCRVVRLYARGHWPCGLLPDERLVVF